MGPGREDGLPARHERAMSPTPNSICMTSERGLSWFSSKRRPLLIRRRWSSVILDLGSPGWCHSVIGAGASIVNRPSWTSAPTSAFITLLDIDQPAKWRVGADASRITFGEDRSALHDDDGARSSRVPRVRFLECSRNHRLERRVGMISNAVLRRRRGSAAAGSGVALQDRDRSRQRGRCEVVELRARTRDPDDRQHGARPPAYGW